ncbi:MAG: AtpZ/AtpI family protein [Bacteroidales bacterium]|nr:AtpZ/AtpI family protein [Bacteroidales bacterium]
MKQQFNNYTKYTNLAFTMIVIILVGVFAGFKLDEFLKWKFPVFTVVLSILSVILAIYYAVKDFIKMK